MTNPYAMIHAYLDQAIDDESFEALRDWLEASPENRREFAIAASVHAGIGEYLQSQLDTVLADFDPEDQNDQSTWWHAMALLDADADGAELIDFTELVSKPVPTSRPSKNKPLSAGLLIREGWGLLVRKSVPWVALSAAIMVACLIGLHLLSNRPAGPIAPVTPADSAVAVITADQDAGWLVEGRRVGDALHADDRLVLLEGAAEITTLRGARALLQAPCEVVVLGENEVRLTRGKLVGKCLTQRSKGFVVDTPTARIVDIGTEFGVYVDATGDVGVRVFSGLVDVETGPGLSQKQSLVTGDLARVESGRLERVAYDTGFDFRRNLISRASVPLLTGQIQWLASPPPSVRLRDFEDSINAYLFLESRDVMVPAGTTINRATPAQPITPHGHVTLDRGVQADVYLLHFDPVNDPEAEPAKVRGRIEFDRPIIAVISHYRLLGRTDELLGHPEVQYESKSPTRGLERPEIEISEDGRSLIVYIDSANDVADQVRILVAAKE